MNPGSQSLALRCCDCSSRFTKIALVPCHAVFFKELAELVLKGELSVVFFLLVDVFLN